MVETTSRRIEFDCICIDLSETRYAKAYISQALIRPRYIKLDGMCIVGLSRNAI